MSGNPLQGRKILVTGGAGLIGSHIVDHLLDEEPEEIVIFDRAAPSFWAVPAVCPIRVVHGDITNPAQVRDVLKGMDFVFHTASLLTREAASDLRAALEVNVVATFRLLEECLAAGVRKIIYSSSVTIYGDPVVTPLAEDHPFHTRSMYGAGKAASELFLRIFKAKGLDYVALRYAVVYGPRQHERGNIIRYLPESFDRIARGLPPVIYGDGAEKFDYIDVEDVARANIVALKSPVGEGAFNIGSGQGHSAREVVQMISELTGCSLSPVYEPEAGLGPKSFVLDVRKAREVLGFEARIPLKEGLRRYFEWRCKNGG